MATIKIDRDDLVRRILAKRQQAQAQTANKEPQAPKPAAPQSVPVQTKATVKLTPFAPRIQQHVGDLKVQAVDTGSTLITGPTSVSVTTHGGHIALDSNERFLEILTTNFKQFLIDCCCYCYSADAMMMIQQEETFG